MGGQGEEKLDQGQARAPSDIQGSDQRTHEQPDLSNEVESEVTRAPSEWEEAAREHTTRLQRANQLLSALIDTMPVGALVSDAEGNLLQTNAVGRAILGTAVLVTAESPERPYTTHEPDGAPLDPQDFPLVRALKEGQVVRDVEMLIRQPDGVERALLAGAAPVLDETGQVVAGIAVFQDITEQKEAQDKLQILADRLEILQSSARAILQAESVGEIISTVLPFSRQLAGCVQASVLAFDRQAGEAIVLGVRDHGKRAFGPGQRVLLDEYWPMEQLTRDEISMVSDISALDVQTPLIEALQAEGLCAVISVPLTLQNELFGALNLSFEAAFDLTDDQVQAIRQMADQLAIGIWQMRMKEELERHAGRLEDMVARRTAALRASEARFRTIFEDSVLGIALLDPKGEIVACNPALQDMLGYGQEELEGTAFTDYGHPDDADADKDLYQALATGDLSYYQIDKRYVRKDGQVRWSELTVSRVQRTRRGEPRRAIAMVADITERKMSQEALVRAERLAVAGRLGASLGHEINNPLQSVIGCLGLAEEILDDGAEVRRYLEIAMEELERAAGIVAQLRDLGREPRVEKAEPTDLDALVEKALLLTRKSCQNAGVEVAWEPAGDLSPVPAVPGRIQQVFLNLILNAVAAMPRGGRLHLSTTATSQPDGVQIRFSDTGVGIEPDRLPRIFEPFHSSRPEGLGLGLYISKQIVKEHDGQIEVASQLGEGTTFTVWLPG